MHRPRSRLQPILVIQIVFREWRQPCLIRSTLLGDLQYRLDPRLNLFGRSPTSSDAAFDKLRTGRFERSLDLGEGYQRDVAQAFRRLQTTNSDNGYRGPARQFLLVHPEQRTCGTDLVWRDQHDHFISSPPIALQGAPVPAGYGKSAAKRNILAPGARHSVKDRAAGASLSARRHAHNHPESGTVGPVILTEGFAYRHRGKRCPIRQASFRRRLPGRCG